MLLMAHTMLDYQQAADQWRHAGAIVREATAATDLLRIPIPQRLALGMADLLTFPDEVERIGRARNLAAAPEPEVPLERHDEPPDAEGQEDR